MKEALQAGGTSSSSSSSQAHKALVKELHSGTARLQQQVQSLQVLFPSYFLSQACNINCWIDVAQRGDEQELVAGHAQVASVSCRVSLSVHYKVQLLKARLVRWAGQHDINYHFEHECDYQRFSEHTQC